ncbi:hypothetical protein CY35_03G033900 [Sphagnum magellanicum]|nr:hypothetical protein CY35_03G033900 [Sphagnum magellanicum]
MPSSQDAAGALAARDKVSKLLNAARDGNLQTFKELAHAIAEGQEIGKTLSDVKDANGRGPLHFAARGGNEELCTYMIEDLKLPVDIRDNDGDTPLLHAARQGHFSTAQCLLNHGADPSATSNENGPSALHHAAGTGEVELMRVLLEKGVEVDCSSDAGPPLIWAAGHEHIRAVEILLDHGANPNATTDDEVTPLLTAAAAGSSEIVELLIKKGADVNASAGGGVTPLHVAADHGDERMVDCLLAAGADPNAMDDEDAKPIHAAAAKEFRAVVERLLPLSTPDPSVADWTVDGLLAHADRLAAQEEASYQGFKEAREKVKEEKPLPAEIAPEKKQAALESKARGDEAFKKKDYMLAVDAYTQAIDMDPTNATILANRSLCWIRLGQAEQALTDAREARRLDPKWSKACYREGAALRLLQRFDEAADAFYTGVTLNPENKELVDAFKEAVEAGRKFHGTA